ncbi:MAG: hypothetical protein SV375_16110 [Thermodesulfobacteriota bacterium]|nr:hypothetical protein [Thermodesulfobacteriota bacterium]
MIQQFVITTACGKRLIGKAVAALPVVLEVLKSGTLVIVAGTTNGYVAEEVLSIIGQEKDFVRKRFFRGITLPPSQPTSENGRLPDESSFPGDVVVTNGIWQKGKTIFDVVDDLKQGDIILKGANALDVSRKQAAILIGHPKAGTIGVAIQAVIGRRVRLILPVGLEKRVFGDLNTLAERLNQQDVHGPRLFPVPGQVITEMDAITLLTGTNAELVAGGGVCGAEGSVRLAVSGDIKKMEDVQTILNTFSKEPGFEL